MMHGPAAPFTCDDDRGKNWKKDSAGVTRRLTACYALTSNRETTEIWPKYRNLVENSQHLHPAENRKSNVNGLSRNFPYDCGGSLHRRPKIERGNWFMMACNRGFRYMCCPSVLSLVLVEWGVACRRPVYSGGGVGGASSIYPQPPLPPTISRLGTFGICVLSVVLGRGSRARHSSLLFHLHVGVAVLSFTRLFLR